MDVAVFFYFRIFLHMGVLLWCALLCHSALPCAIFLTSNCEGIGRVWCFFFLFCGCRALSFPFHSSFHCLWSVPALLRASDLPPRCHARLPLLVLQICKLLFCRSCWDISVFLELYIGLPPSKSDVVCALSKASTLFCSFVMKVAALGGHLGLVWN